MRVSPALFVLFFSCPFAWADPHPEWDTRALVRVLGDDDPRVRDAAEQELERRGASACAVLEEKSRDGSLDAEARGRIRGILRRLGAKRVARYRTLLATRLDAAAAQSLAFSRDGTRLAGLGEAGEVIVWAVADGKILSRCLLPTGTSWSGRIQFSDDGERVAVESNDLILLCDFSNLEAPMVVVADPDSACSSTEARFEALFRQPGCAAAVQLPEDAGDVHLSPSRTRGVWKARGFVFSADPGCPDGGAGREDPEEWRVRTLAVDDAGRVFSWKEGCLSIDDRVLDGQAAGVPAVSPLADAAASLSPLKTLTTWNADGSAAWSRTLEFDADHLAVSPGGDAVAVSAARAGVHLVTKDSSIPLPGLGASFQSLAFSPDGRFLVAAGARTGVVDTETGACTALGTSASFAIPFGDRDEALLLEDGVPSLWSLKEGRRSEYLEALSGHEWSEIAVSPGGRRFAGRIEEHLFGVNDVQDGALLVEGPWALGVAWSPDGTRLASTHGTWNSTLVLRDPDGKALSSTDLEGRLGWVRWSPRGRTMACGGQGELIVAQAGDPSNLVSAPAPVSWLAYLDEDRLLSIDREDRRTLVLRRVEDLSVLESMVLPLERIDCAAIDPARQRLAVAGAGEILLLDLTPAAR